MWGVALLALDQQENNMGKLFGILLGIAITILTIAFIASLIMIAIGPRM